MTLFDWADRHPFLFGVLSLVGILMLENVLLHFAKAYAMRK